MITVTNFTNDYNGTMEISFSNEETFTVKYNANGFGIAVFQKMIETAWDKFTGTPKEFSEKLEKAL